MPARRDLNHSLLRQFWDRFGWRGLLLVATFCCGYLGFVLDAEVSDRNHVVTDGLLTKVYYTLGLFVLGGLDLGTPSGGPVHAQVLLWIAYFMAPLITASAVIESVLKALRPQLRLQRLRDHVVIGGCGRVAMLYLRRLREAHPHVPVVVVELSQDTPYWDEARDVHRAEVIHGDVASQSLLDRLRLRYASRVLLLTGNDFANLDAASKILATEPTLGPRIVVHVSDLRFMLGMSHTKVANSCETFNTHQIAASHLVETELLEHFESTVRRDRVVLAGFGRFGQTVLEQLQLRAGDGFEKVVILDTEASHMATVFDEQVGFREGYTRDVIDGDLRDPHVWRDIHERCALEDAQGDPRERSDADDTPVRPAFIVGSGSDGTNLRTAIWLSQRYPDALVIARSFRRSTFAEEVSLESGFKMVSVADLLTQCMPDRWFD